MPVRFTIDSDAQLVVYKVAGPVASADARSFLASVLRHPNFRTGFNFLGDRRDETAAPDSSYVREAAMLVENHKHSLYGARWALLVSSEVAYGMARMWGLMAGGTGVEIMPFYRLEDAIEWLELPKDYRPPELQGG